MALVAAAALQDGADTLITCGGVQSNHARVTAITAAQLGLRCILVVNAGRRRRGPRLTGNALLDPLAGAEVRYVRTRDERDPAMAAAADEVRRRGGRPASSRSARRRRSAPPPSCPRSTSCSRRSIRRRHRPRVLVGRHAGRAGRRVLLAGVPTRVIGISADESARLAQRDGESPARGAGAAARRRRRPLRRRGRRGGRPFVGEGYGVPTAASREALELARGARASSSITPTRPRRWPA